MECSSAAGISGGILVTGQYVASWTTWGKAPELRANNGLSQFSVLLRVSQRERATAAHLANTEDFMTTLSRTPVVFGFYALCVLTVAASKANAQVLAPVGIVTSEVALPTNQALRVEHATDADAKPLRYMQLPLRVALGVVGSAVGVAAGATAGVALPHADCSCDDPGLENAIYGAAIGSVVMSALLSAAPSLGNNCSFGKRLAAGVLGGAAGALVGSMAGRSAGSIANGSVVYGYLGGSGIGSGVGAWLCNR
jgi:hypothetical protein